MSSTASHSGNRLLSAFPPEVLTRVAGQLEAVDLGRRTIILEPGVATSHLYLPDRGLISLIKTMQDGRTAEVAAVGREGMVGVPALLGLDPPTVEAIVQVDGAAHRIAVVTLRNEMQQSRALAQLILRYMNYRISQFTQNAACNRLHTLRQRCCRWLLTIHDSVQTPTFALTHEFLAMMMGATRSRLSTTLHSLQRAHVIEYRYAAVRIVDRPALEEGACECLHLLRDEADQVCRF